MSRFKKKKGGGTPAISTASLPDIVFMLLFFFMVTTVMRETTLLVENTLPQASEIKKIEDKYFAAIYVGAPVAGMKSKYGTEPRIQLNDAFRLSSDVQEFVAAKRESTSEEKIPQLITCIKADVDAKMGLISDIKQELRKAKAFKINYATFERVE